MKNIAFIGAGRLAQALAQALSRANWPVVKVASRSLASATQLASMIPGCVATSVAEAAACDFVFLTVPDDTVTTVAASLPWRRNQQVVHCSGATELTALDAAANDGALTGGFHPLQIFSDPTQAQHQLAGSAVAIEGSMPVLLTLRQMANALDMKTIEVPPGGRAIYHAGASYAASMLLPLLHEAVTLWRTLGINEDDALQALLPLARGTLNAVASKGVVGALSGPVSRNDIEVVRQHIHALGTLAAGHTALYAELTRRQLQLAVQSGRIPEEQTGDWSEVLRTISDIPSQ